MGGYEGKSETTISKRCYIRSKKKAPASPSRKNKIIRSFRIQEAKLDHPLAKRSFLSRNLSRGNKKWRRDYIQQRYKRQFKKKKLSNSFDRKIPTALFLQFQKNSKIFFVVVDSDNATLNVLSYRLNELSLRIFT